MQDKKQFKIRQEMNKNLGRPTQSDFKYTLNLYSFNYNAEKSLMRKPEGIGYKKLPILLFGCSYTYGDGLVNKDTFSYKLSLFSKRPVYNRAMQGWGVQQMLYQLRRPDFYDEVKPPEYIIYTVMFDHLRRLTRYQFSPPYNYIFLRYKLTKNGFKEIKPFCKPLWALYTVNRIQNIIQTEHWKNPECYKKDLRSYYLMMKECKRLAKIHYPNSKFVILIYRDAPNIFIDDTVLRKKLLEDGFIIIDTKDLVTGVNLSDRKYKTLDNSHPSEKAWDLIVPALVKELNL